MTKVLSTSSADRSTTAASYELNDETYLVDYMETAFSLLYRNDSVSKEIGHIITGDDCNEIRNIHNDTDCNYVRHMVTGGEVDGWYPALFLAPSLGPSAGLCLRTLPIATTLGSPTAEAAKQIEPPEAGDRLIGSVLQRTPLRSSAAPFKPPTEDNTVDTSSETTTRTTLMLCNIPNHYSRALLMDLLRCEGLLGHVRFIYVPMNLRSSGNFGYAFVDFDSASVAAQARQNLEGFTRWNEPNDKVMEIEWSETQGLDAHIQRYRDSPLMHVSVQDELKPALFMHGTRIAFPKPTKSIRAPRLRKANEQKDQLRERAHTA